MEFGWINIFGAGIVILMMIPNILYAVKYKQTGAEKEIPRYLTICEQIGRFGCIVLMWFPLFVWRFEFGSVEEFLIYLIATVILLLGYYLFWVKYARKKTLATAMALAVIPTMLFFLSGVLLHHWTLAAFAVLFGVAHCRITYLTHR